MTTTPQVTEAGALAKELRIAAQSCLRPVGAGDGDTFVISSGGPEHVRLMNRAAELIERLSSTGWRTDMENAPRTHAEWQQRRGVAWDIIDQAINTYDEYMLDDDYDADAKLRQIVKKMRERRDMYRPAPPSDDAMGSEDHSTRKDGSSGTEAPRTKSGGA